MRFTAEDTETLDRMSISLELTVLLERLTAESVHWPLGSKGLEFLAGICLQLEAQIEHVIDGSPCTTWEECRERCIAILDAGNLCLTMMKERRS